MLKEVNMKYSTKKAAQILGVCAETLRRWDKAGKFKPAFKTVGGERRYTDEQLKAFMNKERNSQE